MPVCKTVKIEKYKLYNKVVRDTAEEQGKHGFNINLSSTVMMENSVN